MSSSSYQTLSNNPEQSTAAAAKKIQDLGNRGFSPAGSKKVVRWGRRWNMEVYEKKVEGVERALTAVGAGIATVGFAGLPLASKEFREVAELGFSGVVREKIYTEAPQKTLDPQKLGYDPADSQSIIEFFKDPKTNYTQMGDYYVYFPTLAAHGGCSTALIVDRDFKKGRLLDLHEKESGKPFRNKLQKERAVQTYIVSISDIKAKWKEALPKLAERMVALTPGLTQERALKIIKSRPRSIAISAKDGTATIYVHLDPNSGLKLGSHLMGTLITLEDDTKEEIKRVHGKSMKHKEPLEGKKPFRKPQTPDVEELFTNNPGSRTNGSQNSQSDDEDSIDVSSELDTDYE
jgi:hypothetical protein